MPLLNQELTLRDKNYYVISTMIDVIISSLVFFMGSAAIVYGYLNWRITRAHDDIKWIVAGIIFILVISFDFLTTHVFSFSSQTQDVLHWIRLACDVGAVLLALTLKPRSL
jgi:hypothetical protein